MKENDKNEISDKGMDELEIDKILEEAERLTSKKKSDSIDLKSEKESDSKGKEVPGKKSGKSDKKSDKVTDKADKNDEKKTSDSSGDRADKQKKSVEKSPKSKKKKLYKVLYIVAMTILISIFVSCSIYLIVYFWQAKKIDKKVDELKDMMVIEEDSDYEIAEEETVVDETGKKTEYVYINGTKVQRKFARIYEKNNDFIGWLTISGTEIDYPVMFTLEDEEYYLHRDFEKNYNGNGTLFIDTASDVEKPSDNMIIYGHNMKNGKMFHDILKYEDEDFYKSHKNIKFDTIYGDGTYEVIAAFRTEIYDKDYTGFKYYAFFNADTPEDFTTFVKECQERTPYTVSTSASFGDKLITLSTCAYHSDEGRFVVVAKKVE